MPVLGYLDPTAPADFAGPRRVFLQGLKEAGYVEGENVAISYRFAEALPVKEARGMPVPHSAHRTCRPLRGRRRKIA